MKKYKLIKEKTSTITSSILGIMGFLGGYQVCHNICLGLITLLSVIGITVIGMPLLFLTKVAVPFWTAAVALFLLTLVLCVKKKCVSQNVLLFNAGIIIAGFPFSFAQKELPLLWIVGGTLVLVSLFLFIKERYVCHEKRKRR